eukprot:6203852-Pleurochrysis_carterae.AAC.1
MQLRERQGICSKHARGGEGGVRTVVADQTMMKKRDRHGENKTSWGGPRLKGKACLNVLKLEWKHV